MMNRDLRSLLKKKRRLWSKKKDVATSGGGGDLPTAAAVEGFRLGSIEESPSNSSSPRAADQHWKKRGMSAFGGEERPPRDDVVRR